jgi:mRNA interferase YafQ
MRTIKYTTKFKRDFKREKKSGRHKSTLEKDLLSIVKLLAKDAKLPPRNYDHQLNGNWKDHRDCHIWPDLVLIYRKPDDNTLELVRIGSHSELGL